MTPFTFTNAASDWQRFCEESNRWKPASFDTEAATRLAYYLDQQLDDLLAEMKRRFPETHEKMTPVTLPLVRLLTTEAAKVFLSTMKLDLVEAGKDQPSDALDAWWRAAREQMGLALRLKRADAYTWLLRTAALRIGYDEGGGRFFAHVIFPQSIRVVMDPSAPMDLDRAYGIAVRVAGEGGVERWEFWCARDTEAEKPRHGLLSVKVGPDEKTEVTWDADKGDPLRGPGGRAIVPLVLFTAHTEELGLFSMEGKGLVEANRSLNVLVTDIHNIAEAQGFGLLVLETGSGHTPPAKMVRSPNTAISLPEGIKAQMLDPGAPIAELVQLADATMKRAAVMRGLPAGAVSIEARAVASGVALQIEMRPLLEQRADSIEVYREPMRRLWDVIRATHNAYRETPNFLARVWARLTGKGKALGEIGENVEMRWTPGDIVLPVDDVQRVDTAVAKMKNRLCSRAEAIAELRGVSLEEAKKIAEEIDAERGPEMERERLDLDARRRELAGEPPADEPLDTEEPPAPAKAVPGAPGAEVVQDTALNGAQVSSLLEIVQAAADRDLPLDTAQALVEAAFPGIKPELVARIMAGVKRAPPPKPAPALVPPPFPPRPQEGEPVKE